MKEGPNISHIAALIGEPARSNMLVALMDGRALTATELTLHAGVTKQTTSNHLAKLRQGGLVSCETQGRHKYFKLAHSDVASALEILMSVAQRNGGSRTRTGPKEPALRKARICYDHLAGDMGVFVLDRMLALKWVFEDNNTYTLSEKGIASLKNFDIDIKAMQKKKRPMCKSCLDWSVRRHHLAGSVGAAIYLQIIKRNWAKRSKGSRVINFTENGEAKLRHLLS